jgi:hypothetical protein
MSLLSLVLEHLAPHLSVGAYFRTRRALCWTNHVNDDVVTATMLGRGRLSLKSRMTLSSLSSFVLSTPRCHECGRKCRSRSSLCLDCLLCDEAGFRHCLTRTQIRREVRKRGKKMSVAVSIFRLLPVESVAPSGAFLYSKRKVFASSLASLL